MNEKKNVSSRDVAREAGVSQATVSYILNNVKGISIKPETRAAVMDAVKRLNYHPNEIARGMKLNRSMSIGVVTDRNVTNFYFMKTLEGIRDGIQKNNYAVTLLFNKPDDRTEAEFISYYNSNRLDGMIFAFASLDTEMVDYLNTKGIPFVLVEAVKSEMDVYGVCTDYLNNVPGVVTHFLSQGVNRIGYAGPTPGKVKESRLDAFKEAMVQCGLEVDEEMIATSDFNDEEIFDVIIRLLSSDKRPGALIAGSPRFGLFAVKCAQCLNIKVPDDLKIIALGTSNFFKVTYPSLSAVELPLYDMGLRAAEMLFELMSGQSSQKTVILPSELVLRDSS